MIPHLRRGIVPLAIGVIVALAYWPGLHAFWGRDDFMQLAFARLLGSPWPLFVHDHYFPVPGSIFRPLGFASFWLWQALFGTDYFAHAFADMLLHIAVAIVLYRVMRSAIDPMPAALCALLFAVHPAVIGTALWWSARFDLLAALFAFVAMSAAFDYAESKRKAALLIAGAGLLAALLSKETALAASLALALVFVRRALADSAQRASAIRALAAVVSITIVFLIWRGLVLGTATSGLTGETSLVAAGGKGFVDWFRHLAGYLSFWPRLGATERIIEAGVLLAAMGCFLVARRRGGTEPLAPREVDLVLSGLSLAVFSALLQGPVVALNATPLGAEASAVEAAMQSRLYYLGFGGFAIALSVPVRRMLAARAPRGRRAFVAGVFAIGAGLFFWISRESAMAYANVTSASKPLAEAAAVAVDRLALPPAHCHVVLLGVEPPAEWGIYVSMDSVVKALSSDLSRVSRCYVHADYPTFFHLMSRGASPDDAAPYGLRLVGGQPLPWLHVGDAVAAYIDPPAKPDPAERRGIQFLRFENGTFRDVTAEVTDGRLAVTLQ